jgi:hypothetical protein
MEYGVDDNKPMNTSTAPTGKTVTDKGCVHFNT